jgi:hypothetical protein
MTEKKCVKCERVLAVADFPADKRTREGLSSYCRPCHNAATRQWRRDKKLARRAAEPERALEALRAARQRAAERRAA